jgi:hypothetical protein
MSTPTNPPDGNVNDGPLAQIPNPASTAGQNADSSSSARDLDPGYRWYEPPRKRFRWAGSESDPPERRLRWRRELVSRPSVSSFSSSVSSFSLSPLSPSPALLSPSVYAELGDLAESALNSSFSSSLSPEWQQEFQSGPADRYSDFTVKNGKYIYHTHACLLARHSSFFDRLVDWPGGDTVESGGTNFSINREIGTKNDSKNNSRVSTGSNASTASGSSSSSNSSAISNGNGETQTDAAAGENGARSSDIADLHPNNSANNCSTSSDVTDLLPGVCGSDSAVFETVLDFVYSTAQATFVIPLDKAFLMFVVADALGMKALFERVAFALELYSKNL